MGLVMPVVALCILVREADVNASVLQIGQRCVLVLGLPLLEVLPVDQGPRA